MNDIPLKTKSRIIVQFIKGVRAEDISFSERVTLDAVLSTIREWEEGFLNVNIGNDIPAEIKELAAVMRDERLTVQDLLEGYAYYEIFREREKVSVLRIIDEIYAMNENERKKFIEVAMKMISFRKYENIEFTDIPKALEDMVYRGKELNRDIKSREIALLELTKRKEEMESEIRNMGAEMERMRREVETARFLKERLNAGDDEIRSIVDGLLHAGFSRENIVEISQEISLVKSRGFTVEQFLKVARYYDDLLKLGLKVSAMEDLADRVRESGMDIDDYLNERYAYVRDKNAYIRAVKELADTHRRLEKDLKALEEEIQKKRNRLEKG